MKFQQIIFNLVVYLILIQKADFKSKSKNIHYIQKRYLKLIKTIKIPVYRKMLLKIVKKCEKKIKKIKDPVRRLNVIKMVEKFLLGMYKKISKYISMAVINTKQVVKDLLKTKKSKPYVKTYPELDEMDKKIFELKREGVEMNDIARNNYFELKQNMSDLVLRISAIKVSFNEKIKSIYNIVAYAKKNDNLKKEEVEIINNKEKEEEEKMDHLVEEETQLIANMENKMFKI
jgi:hypothetical protein